MPETERANNEEHRHHGHECRRLGDASRLRPTPRRAAGQAEGRAGALRSGSGPGLRLLQHPLHDRDPHRHVGDGQAHPLQPDDAQFRPDLVGLRLGSQAPQALQPVARRHHDRDGCRPQRSARGRQAAAARKRRPRRHLDAARGVPARRGDRRGRRQEDQARAREVRAREPAPRRRRHRAADPVRAAARGHRGRGRPAAVHGGPPHQDRRRDPAAHPGRVDGGCRVRGALPVPAARRPRERGRGPRGQDAVRPRLGVRRGGQRDLRASAARRIRTSSATGSSVREIPRSSTSCTASTATAPATTARSRSARPARRSATRTPEPASTWTVRSRS